MSEMQDINRFAKGARGAVQGLRVVLHPDSVLCPECEDDETRQPCLRCLNVGFVVEPADD